jgi:prophage DNA circulation protein
MAISSIRDLANYSGWRSRLLPAHFDGRMFHVESGSVESGRAIVLHEFPKRDVPYAEDMGKRAEEFSVRGYIIQYPKDTGVPLYSRNYTLARDQLRARLQQGGAGTLQLPMIEPMSVVCSRARLTEEERLGGYCVFDMSFVEQGASPLTPVVDPTQSLVKASQDLRQTVIQAISQPQVSATPRLSTAVSGGRPF